MTEAARLTRRRLLDTVGRAAVAGAAARLSVAERLLGGTALASTGGSAPGASGARKQGPYRSAPGLIPPQVYVSGAGAVPGYLFLGPGGRDATSQAGPLILDQLGEPVWFKPLGGGQWVTNFSVEQYQGEPVLAWWQGQVVPPGFGKGEGVVVDSHYRQVARVRGANGRSVDMHEFTLTPQGTALFTCMPQTVETDLSSAGGPSKGKVLESVIQEVDVRTGKLLLEWRSLDHVPVSESYLPVSTSSPWDYLHVNAVSLTTDGHLLVSGRHTWTLYKVNRHTGKVMWRLGGKHTNFKLPGAARFTWQHDSRQLTSRLFTLFDNGSNGLTNTERQSRALFLEISGNKGPVRLVKAYHSPKPLRSITMGSVQLLPDGHVLVGWGSVPQVSEFAPNGKQLVSATFPSGKRSYRAFRMPWTGTPEAAPSVAAVVSGSSMTVYASWNGATEVASWRFFGGASPSTLAPQAQVARSGFETSTTVPAQAYAAAQALDAAGNVLGTSKVIATSGG